MTTRIGRRIFAAGLVSAGLLIHGVAPAQEARLDSRWYAWLGCWQPEAATAGEVAGAPTVCVVPASGTSGVEIATVVDGKVVGRERMDATGQQVRADRENCTGWTAAEWAPDGRRIYRRSEYRCPGGFERRSTGIMAMSPAGEWIDVDGLAVNDQEAVRALRYRPLSAPGEVPAEMAVALEGHGLAASTARMAAAAVTTADVVEASRHVGAGVVEAWLVERGQGFALEMNAKRLVEMADAGVPARVIDMMVALSYPERFAVNRSSGEAEVRAENRADPSAGWSGRTAWNLWMYPGLGYYPGYLDRYGTGYDYGRYGWYYERPVIVVVQDPDGDSEPRPRPRGRMINGRGYTPGGSGADSPDQGSSRPSSSSGSSGSSSSGGSSAGSTSSGDSGESGGSGSVRTAKPRS